MSKPSHRLILIGLDGATFDVIVPFIKKGYLPTFRRIIEEGSHGVLNSTMPFNTLPAWNSIFTGVNPGKHGITDFVIRKNGLLAVPSTRDRMVDSIWGILSRNGVKLIVVNEPVTYPPEPINGIMISGFLVPSGARDYAYPSGILDEVEKHCGKYLPELETGFEQMIIKDPKKGARLIDDFAKSTFEASSYLAKNYEWDLLATIFTSTDRLQHFYFHDEPTILHHYELIDGMISKLTSLDEQANVMVVSDHGFGILKKSFYVNSWLEGEGLVQRKSNTLSGVAAKYKLSYPRVKRYLEKMKLYNLVARIVPSNIKRSLPESDIVAGIVDYSRSSAFCAGTGSGIFVADNALNSQAELVSKLRKFRPAGEYPLQEVHSQEGLIWGDYASRAPDILVTPSRGYEISSHLEGKVIAKPEEFGDSRTGTHRPEGIFVAVGPSVRREAISRLINTWDITPTILRCLGIPAFTYMDGKPVAEIFEGNTASAEHSNVQISYREELRQRIREFQNKK